MSTHPHHRARTAAVWLTTFLLGTATAYAHEDGLLARGSEPGPGDPAFTLNRVRLYVIAAKPGANRVVLPPLQGDQPEAVMNEMVESTNRAVEKIKRRYPFSDLQVVGLSQYLLQARQARGGAFSYQLLPEPGAISYSNDSFRGELTAGTRDGQLSMNLEVLRDRESLFAISLLLEPGRTLVLGQQLPDGGALFAVLTLEAPEPPAKENEKPDQRRPEAAPRLAAAAAPVESLESPVEEDPDRIYMRWDSSPRMIDYVHPDYPTIARKAGVEGSVTLHLVVGVDGRVEQVKVVRASPRILFDEAATAAVLKWRYEPALVDGRPVRAMVSQTVRFTLDDHGGR